MRVESKAGPLEIVGYAILRWMGKYVFGEDEKTPSLENQGDEVDVSQRATGAIALGMIIAPSWKQQPQASRRFHLQECRFRYDS